MLLPALTCGVEVTTAEGETVAVGTGEADEDEDGEGVTVLVGVEVADAPETLTVTGLLTAKVYDLASVLRPEYEATIVQVPPTVGV